MKTTNKSVALLFSGGQDSFLSAIRLIERGYKLHLLTFDNGCMRGLSNVQRSVSRLRRRYGNKILTYKILNITYPISVLRETYINTSIAQMAEVHPGLTINQVNCLTCHTAMLIKAIQYCKQNNISIIAEGARRSQLFATQQPEILRQYKQLLSKNNLHLLLPVEGIADDYTVKMLIADAGFLPKMYEAQCYVGHPMNLPLQTKQLKSISRFLHDVLIDKAKVEDLI